MRNKRFEILVIAALSLAAGCSVGPPEQHGLPGVSAQESQATKVSVVQDARGGVYVFRGELLEKALAEGTGFFFPPRVHAPDLLDEHGLVGGIIETPCFEPFPREDCTEVIVVGPDPDSSVSTTIVEPICPRIKGTLTLVNLTFLCVVDAAAIADLALDEQGMCLRDGNEWDCSITHPALNVGDCVCKETLVKQI